MSMNPSTMGFEPSLRWTRGWVTYALPLGLAMTRRASSLIWSDSSKPLRNGRPPSSWMEKFVALDPAGQPVGFQALQGRIHLTGGTERYLATKIPVAFIAFDILQDGLQDLTQLPLTARRARLEPSL